MKSVNDNTVVGGAEHRLRLIAWAAVKKAMVALADLPDAEVNGLHHRMLSMLEDGGGCCELDFMAGVVEIEIQCRKRAQRSHA